MVQNASKPPLFRLVRDRPEKRLIRRPKGAQPPIPLLPRKSSLRRAKSLSDASDPERTGRPLFWFRPLVKKYIDAKSPAPAFKFSESNIALPNECSALPIIPSLDDGSTMSDRSDDSEVDSLRGLLFLIEETDSVGNDSYVCYDIRDKSEV